MITFSVIVPNYNHASFLKKRIDSILSQTNSDYELILLDDHSQDKSRDIIASYRSHPHVSHIVWSEANSGSPFRQWEKGIRLAAGNWIWIAESDDEADPGFLEAVSGAISHSPDCGIIYTDGQVIGEETGFPSKKTFSAIKNDFLQTDKWNHAYRQDGPAEINECLKYFCSVNNASSAVMRKDLLLGCLDQLAGYRVHGDWFCYLKLAQQAPVAYLPFPLAKVRIHASSYINEKKDIVLGKTEHFRILLWLLRLPGVTERRKLIRFFSEQHLGFGLKDGIRRIARIKWNYFRLSFTVAVSVLSHICLVKITRKKIKPVF